MQESAFTGNLAPPLECDLIMKGGVTSGVVFPKALTALARKYRFRSIGGTSAGAIAAVLAAAAEYRRQSAKCLDGFEKIDKLPDELGRKLGSLFQPLPEFQELFDTGLAAMKKGKLTFPMVARLMGVSCQLVVGTGTLAVFIVLFAFSIMAAIGTFKGLTAGFIGVLAGIACVILPLVVVALVVSRKIPALKNTVFMRLPQEDFGVCSGISQVGPNPMAFTDWIHFHIQSVAGRTFDCQPLTIGELKDHDIEIASVTTDLSSQRPYQLPIKSQGQGHGLIHYFSKSEFEKILPLPVVDYLVGRTKRVAGVVGSNGKDDLYHLPGRDDWPLLLVARMSLSFPGLIRAVPLYREDKTLAATSQAGKKIVHRCLFSDGGITSNFPIHFFDNWLPGRPTFGISLSEFDASHDPFEDRILWRKDPGQHNALKVREVSTLPDFIGAMFDSARNWQEMLQTQLDGYADRIVEIRLKPDEGGLNLDMEPATISNISKLGGEAGKLIVDQFNLDEHRWRRSLTLLHRVGQQLIKVSDRQHKYDFRHLIANHRTNTFPGVSAETVQRERYAFLVKVLTRIGDKLESKQPLVAPSADVTNLRITPSIDSP